MIKYFPKKIERTFLLIAFLVTAIHFQPFAQSLQAPKKLLFIGNSLTYRNGGIEKHIVALAASAPTPNIIIANKATKGGATLKILNELTWVHDSINNGGYNLTILQEDIPELTEHNVEPFYEFASKFNTEIKLAGSKTLLYMAWPYERLNWINLEQITEAHKFISKKLGIPVAPVGIAFENALKANPSIAMLGPDKEHASIHGTYLAVCVIYATIFQESPLGYTYFPIGISKDEAPFLQKIAWETVKNWKVNEGLH
jgi:hypothetical protein